MHVLHVYSGNLYGGIETVLVSLARRRDDRLNHAFALCFEGRLSRELEALGAPVHQLGEVRMRRPNSLRRARSRLGELLDAGTYDRVICHAAWSQALFGGVARRIGVPLVLWVHDAMRGNHWTERLAKRTSPELIICNSHYTAILLPALYPNVPITVLYAPVETAASRSSSEDRRGVRLELETADDAVVIVQASRMQRWKGHETVLAALSRLRSNPRWVLWIVGGPQRTEEREYQQVLVAAAHQLSIADRIRWAHERADVRRLFAAADVYCQTNLTPEPFGMVYVEALAAGLPVVASRGGGVVEIVDESCGMLVPAGDADALAQTLERLIADDAYRTSLAALGPLRARRLCDPDMQIARLRQMLASVSLRRAAG